MAYIPSHTANATGSRPPRHASCTVPFPTPSPRRFLSSARPATPFPTPYPMARHTQFVDPEAVDLPAREGEVPDADVIEVDQTGAPVANAAEHPSILAVRMQGDLLRWLIAHPPDFTIDSLLAWRVWSNQVFASLVRASCVNPSELADRF